MRGGNVVEKQQFILLQILINETNNKDSLLSFFLFKIIFVITPRCNFQTCIIYQGLQNSANLAEIRFKCVHAHCILQRFLI
ncbi:hypothetical protein BpHYR1_050592 [Brachionus plicatilis]|uniref:Uncharacterized protein n=1 Tax=Brachionus plicatilis TaxID=10195 RepID=A0A3M7S401_BRAPC|nr:hypothetical protein BpHYR1_050592 [Brachionus plicatilis]